MLITLKTLQQKTFTVDIDENETVKALKEKIAGEKGTEFPADSQKLIYAGKILDDAKCLGEYKIEEKNFVVIMVTKPKAKPAPEAAAPTQAAAAPPTAASSSTPSTAVTSEEKPMEEEKPSEAPVPMEETSSTPSAAAAEAATAATTTTTTTTTMSTDTTATASTATTESSDAAGQAAAESLLVTGATYERTVSQLVEMGFERDQVLQALRASFNNPDRAVEYLFNGIPDQLEPPSAAVPVPPVSQAQAPVVAPAPPPPPPSSGTGGTGGSETVPTTQAPSGGQSAGGGGQQPGPEDPLAFLRSQPQFNQMRALVQTNPGLLNAFLAQIRATNPRLLQMITQNQERFVEMLNESEESADGGVGTGGGGGGSGGGVAVPGAGGQGQAGGGGGNLAQGGSIQVTPQEREAIERLKALGFPEGLSIQAYFACEKNEELAANFLLSQNFEEDELNMGGVGGGQS